MGGWSIVLWNVKRMMVMMTDEKEQVRRLTSCRAKVSCHFPKHSGNCMEGKMKRCECNFAKVGKAHLFIP